MQKGLAQATVYKPGVDHVAGYKQIGAADYSERTAMTAEENQDWLVYCSIASNPKSSPLDLAQRTGLDLAAVERALSRLDNNLLITKRGGVYSVATFGESIIRCRLRYSRDLPLVFEDGVIRARKDREE